ncbi:MAG: hypothetical protein ACU0B5_02520 [Roseovarius sp.]
MILDLLDSDDYETLPTEAGPRWVALESLARRRLHLALQDDDSKRTERYLKLQYMKIVVAAAEELGIQNVSIPGGNDPAGQLDAFMIGAQAAATRIYLSNGAQLQVNGLRIGEKTKEEIRGLVNDIQCCIPDLNLTSRHEERLKKALIDFQAELDLPRSRYSIGAGHLVTALTVLNLAVSTTAISPTALETIGKIQAAWGEEKERTEAQIIGIDYEKPSALLEAPRKQIEDNRKRRQ